MDKKKVKKLQYPNKLDSFRDWVHRLLRNVYIRYVLNHPKSWSIVFFVLSIVVLVIGIYFVSSFIYPPTESGLSLYISYRDNGVYVNITCTSLTGRPELIASDELSCSANCSLNSSMNYCKIDVYAVYTNSSEERIITLSNNNTEVKDKGSIPYLAEKIYFELWVGGNSPAATASNGTIIPQVSQSDTNYTEDNHTHYNRTVSDAIKYEDSVSFAKGSEIRTLKYYSVSTEQERLNKEGNRNISFVIAIIALAAIFPAMESLKRMLLGES